MNFVILHLTKHFIMKTYIYLTLAVFLFTACKPDKPDTEKNSSTEITSEEQSPQQNFWQPIVMHVVKDQKGVILATYPLPEDWDLNDPNYLVTGPNNIRVKAFPLQVFTRNLDPSMDYIYSQTPQRAMPEINQLIQEDVFPWTQKNGYTILDNYELPDVAKMDAWYNGQLFKAMPSIDVNKAYGINLQDSNGNPALLIMHLQNSQSQGLEIWNYHAELLESNPEVFEIAKKQYLFALENTRYNLDPIMEFNKAEMQRIGQNWAAFNQRMADNQRAFEAQQRIHINKTDAVNEAIMAGWRSTSASTDRQQGKTIDGIYGREIVQNPETGQQTKLDDAYGYNRYWMNSNGDYIASENQLYNPNQDENMNQTNWQELQKAGH